MSLTSPTRENPYLASIKERTDLSTPNSGKKVQHIVLDIEGSGISYEVGDCVAILPQNHQTIIHKTLEALDTDGNENVFFKKNSHNLRTLLQSHLSLTKPTKKLIRTLVKRHTHKTKQKELEHLLQPENKQRLKDHLSSHEIWDLIAQHKEAYLSAQELIDHLPALMPRFYSIASSMNHVGSEIHLTVRHLEYETQNKERKGVCTTYVCEEVPLHEKRVPLYIHKAPHFRLPKDPHTPIIMIGPGTGLAPFRGFLQERLFQKSEGNHWLFFGERKIKDHFYYQSELEELVNKGFLQLETAFSRDQEHKVYVQHKLWEERAKIWEWLNQGAYLYVCGDAKQMAPQVEATLNEIAQTTGRLTPEEARCYIKALTKEGRYRRDVY